MQAESLKRTATGKYGFVAAVFTSCAHANDAVSDLNREGFTAERIGVAFPGVPCDPPASGSHHTLGEEHSFLWRLRRSFEHDLHRSGDAQMSGKATNPSDTAPPAPYSEVGLSDTLGALGMPEDSIQLIHREMGEKGAFLLVDAGGLWQKAELVLQRNGGVIRTDAVTNQSPSPAVKAALRSDGLAHGTFEDD